ncbi:hypothetical protein [Serratia rhizosphaerae]|uniref:Uncharacterized protein n=1 Tax=Serratia rhizosphaerae TaxID=2597702 RepID=A0ABX6GNY7_9GAMM|nr:hypothetical protein [Serratia rhizosphaerae]QHA88001.1 hypothetical protein FO014_14090 [Serratia rhizosphaerae]
MKLGFLAGALLATWLSLTYPAEMKAVFDEVITLVQKVAQPDSVHVQSTPVNEAGVDNAE